MELLVVSLEKSVDAQLRCLPVLLYCTEACPLLSRDLNSMSFAMNRVLMKIFCSRSSAVVEECRTMFGVPNFRNAKMN